MQEAALHISYTRCRADVCDFNESLDFIDRYPNLGNSTFFFLFSFLLSVDVNKLKLSLTICLFPIQSTGACYKFNSSSLEHYSVYTEPINTELKLKFLECLYTESVYKQCHFSLGVGQNLLYHMLAFIWSQKSVNSLIRKQILKAKLAVSPHAVTDKYASSRFPFHRNFSGNNTPFEHSTCHAPFLYFQPCPPVRFPPTCKQMEMSYGLTFFPYGFVSPACQANGKQISRGPTADCSSEKEEEKRKTHTRTRNEITNISVAWLWNATTEVLQQHR